MKKLINRYSKKTKLFIFTIILLIPIFIYAYEPNVGCDPDWLFFGWSRSYCALDGGSQGVGHSHTPDNKACVYYYEEYRYFLGIKIDYRIVQVTQPCPD
ncbi:hypothetical protein EOJ36_11265 [Sandaracinomonas limnophila]|uniref:Uncharacterized protein n=1 Tax=Sandaracinomonas limnophila TaxID=1862386 RepID=A0A437PLY7_9BACT|nr:hypothetical protein [Sandaracinomonas limnophila]RVU23306.1 hypothetical protein EOJ36_11265 [Sandaracinomonas limnophila]